MSRVDVLTPVPTKHIHIMIHPYIDQKYACGRLHQCRMPALFPFHCFLNHTINLYSGFTTGIINNLGILMCIHSKIHRLCANNFAVSFKELEHAWIW